eukprot:XP_011433863.2 PREDICTED: uncharacterized protein LOC105332838 isoform X2 [Crassostrea gigas]
MTTTFTIVYVTEDQPAGNCLYSFNVRMWESVSSFRNAFRLTCGELETGSISIENLELSPLAFQVNEVFHVKFSGEGTETSRDICMDMIEIISNGNQNYLKPFSVISCGASHSAVKKKQTTRSAAFEYNCTEMLGAQPLASSGGVRCVHCFPGNYLNSTRCKPCLQGTYQAVLGQLTCDVCPTGKHVTGDRTKCLDSVCVSTFLSQKTQNIDLTCTSENQMCMSTCFGGYIQDDGGLSTVYNCSGEGWFPPLKSCISYTIPCGLDQLSSAIPNSKYTCAAHNQTCTVECSSGYVTSEGEVSVECRCEGDVLTPNRKLCLEYDIPFTTSALYTTYSTVDQVALSCLQDFREITERNKDLFQKTITDYCGDLGINAGGVKIENITSISLAFQITNTILITFYEESVDVREVCLDYIMLIFLNVPSLLMPYSRLNCTSGLSDVTKVSASHGSPSYSCNNRTYLVNRTSQVYCVPCAPGMYMVSSQCVPCPEGHYQPLPGQLTCEPCTENRTVVGSGTNCTVDDENDFNLRKSQVGPTGLTETEIIVIAAVSVCVFFFLAVIATVYYCKKSKAKRRTSHADVPGDAKSGDGVSVKSDEYLRGSHEELIPGKSGSTNDPKWTYRDEQLIEKSTFASANEAKALDVLNTIIDINIDNEECITAQPPVCENVREGKWRPLHVRHKNESNVAVVINKAKETEPDKAPCRTLSDYDNFQIYVPEPEPSDPD